jgi:hypothetical protein
MDEILVASHALTTGAENHLLSNSDSMFGGSLVTTAWRALRLRMEEETAPRYGGQLQIY